MNYYESEYYNMYANHQEMLRKYHASFLMKPNYVNTNYRNWKVYHSDREMNNLRFMVMSVGLMLTKGHACQQEIDYLINLYKVNCENKYTNHYQQLLCIVMNDNNSELEWALNISYGSYSMNKEMIMKLFELAAIDGQVTKEEHLFVKNVAERIGISSDDFMEMKQQLNIEMDYENHTFNYCKDFGQVPFASFLAKTPGQYLYNQSYNNWRDLCYDTLLQQDDMKNLAFLVLASVVIVADGPINQAEQNYMEKLYDQVCGRNGSSRIYMLKLQDILREPLIDWQKYADKLYNMFYEEDKRKAVGHWEKSKKEEILRVLFGLAEVDCQITHNELNALYAIAQRLEVVGLFQEIASD